MASFSAKRAPYWEPDSAQPRLFLSLLPRHLLEPHASGTLQCSSLSHSSSPTWPLRLLAPWCRPPRAPYEELHSDVSGTSSHLLFFLCASFCQTASPRSGASDFRSPPIVGCFLFPAASRRMHLRNSSGAVFACTVLPVCLLRPHSPLLGAGWPPGAPCQVEPTSGSSRLRARGRAVSRSLFLPSPESQPCHPRECMVHASAHLYQRLLA